MRIYSIGLKNRLKNRNIFAIIKDSELDSTYREEAYKFIVQNKAKFILKNTELQGGEVIYNDDFSVYDDVWSDILPTNITSLLFSEKLKTIITDYLTGHEMLTWLPVKVVLKNEKRQYYFMSFERKLNVLNKEKSIFLESDKDCIVMSFFSSEKLKKYSLFCEPRENYFLPTNVYFTDKLMKVIKGLKIPDIGFEENKRID